VKSRRAREAWPQVIAGGHISGRLKEELAPREIVDREIRKSEVGLAHVQSPEVRDHKRLLG
jgi:hypothetical protein